LLLLGTLAFAVLGFVWAAHSPVMRRLLHVPSLMQP